MIFHDLFYDGKSDAGSFVFIPSVESLKYFKDPLFVLGLKPYAVVGNSEMVVHFRWGHGRQIQRTAANNFSCDLNNRCNIFF